MLENRTGSSSISPNKTFSGVRFVLFGFDPVTEVQYRSELVRRGGTDVGRYNERCTHVIVSGRVYDDPVCVAAREDGKTLVTDMWIDDCIDFGTLADASRILYRPPKDMDGIPGSNKLCICLTGYQRQEREDIMKMVSLMGATFTKPLIANKVTHLICYKFEGEKYELAKKVKIKLVNHRWLEDCLKAWEILPIDNYTKSGWELEILEVEARDSEEETEDPGTNIMGTRSTGGTSSSRGEVPAPADSHVLTPNVGVPSIQQKASSLRAEIPSLADSHVLTLNKGESSIQQKAPSLQAEIPSSADSRVFSPKKAIFQQKCSDATGSHTTENLPVNNNLSTPCKENSFGDVLGTHNFNSTMVFDRQDSGSTAPTTGSCHIEDTVRKGKLLIPPDNKLETNGSKLLSNIVNAKTGSSGSGEDERYSTLSCSRKTPEKAVPELPFQSCAPTKDNSEKKSALRETRIKCESNDLQSPTASNILPKKRKLSVSRFGSKSPKSEGQESRPPSHGTSINMGVHAQLEPTSAISMNHGVIDTSDHSERASISNSQANEAAGSSKFKSLSYKKRSLKHVQPSSNTKISVSGDSPSVVNKVDLLQNVQPMQALDNTTAINSKVSALETRPLGGLVSPEDKMLRDLPLGHESRLAMDIDGSLISTTRMFESLVSHGRGEASLEEKTSETFSCGPGEPDLASKPDKGDTAMMDASDVTANETWQQEPLDKGVQSPVNKESNARKISRTASTGTCKESTKAVLGVHTKKVAVRRKLSSKPKISTENVNQEKCVALNKSLSPKKAVRKSGKVGKVNEQIDEKKKEIESVSNERIDEKKKTVETVSNDVVGKDEVKLLHHPFAESSCKKKISVALMDPEKENKPKENGSSTSDVNCHLNSKINCKGSKKSKGGPKAVCGISNAVQTINSPRSVRSEPVWFILSGHRLQRKELQTLIRRLKGKCCRDSHNWSYQATHFIVPDPVRRTEKFFAAAAAGRWILKTDYLTASIEAGKFLAEEPYEWHGKGLTEDGAVNLESPRKWRLLRERTGHGAFYGMRILIYGECIAPSLDTLKRVVKAGDGTILATSPPYTRFLNSGVDYVIVSPSMPRVDSWIQEFLRHEIPCIVADYLVEYVCKAGYPLERHVLYKTHTWAEKSFANLLKRSEEVVHDSLIPSEEATDDISCSVCGSHDREEVMLICGDESGSVGCGVGTHIDCCDPPLEAVPEGDWFCPNCSRKPKTPRKGAKCK